MVSPEDDEIQVQEITTILPATENVKSTSRWIPIARWLAWTLVVIYFILSAIGLYLQFLTDTTPGDFPIPLLPYFLTVIVVAIWPVIGAKIISRHPLHPVGWLLFATFPLIAIVMFAFGYASYAVSLTPGLLPIPGTILFWLKDTGFPLVIVTITLMYLLFPTGKLLSPRWRIVAWASAGALLVFIGLLVVKPGPLSLFPSLDNPDAVSQSVWTVLFPLYPAMMVLLTLCNLAALVSLFVRMRQSQGDESQQVKWLIIPAMIYWAGIFVFFLSDLFPSGFLVNLGSALDFISVPAIVIAVALAIFKFRLYDVDLILNRTLVYGTLTACVVGLYVLVVGAFGAFFQTQGNLIIALLATGIVAALFQPLRERLQRGVNRLIYGERDDPVEALSRFGRQLETAVPTNKMLPTLVETIAQTLKLPYVAIHLPLQKEDKIAALYGDLVPELVQFPLVYQGEDTGQLVVGLRRPGSPFRAAEMRLLRNIARQASTAVHAVQLTTDLQRSRQNLVTAREEERLRLRRDLHDGLGPALASVIWQVDSARDMIPTNPSEAAQLLESSIEQAQAALTDIRRLVYGLRPPALDELGLVGALEQSSRQHPQTSVTIDSPAPFPSLPAAVEVAAYRIVQEALKNAIEHGKAKNCVVCISLDGGPTPGCLCLTIRDDGLGLPGVVTPGVGLVSMRERAEELGGAFAIHPPQAGGTEVEVRLPLE